MRLPCDECKESIDVPVFATTSGSTATIHVNDIEYRMHIDTECNGEPK